MMSMEIVLALHVSLTYCMYYIRANFAVEFEIDRRNSF
jgi:hypothetical protein